MTDVRGQRIMDGEGGSRNGKAKGREHSVDRGQMSEISPAAGQKETAGLIEKETPA